MEESVSIEKMEGKNLGKMTANSLDFQDTQDLWASSSESAPQLIPFIQSVP